MGVTGHKTEAIFHRYNMLDEDDKKDAVNSLERYLKRAGHKSP
jgi:hypothetical protein